MFSPAENIGSDVYVDGKPKTKIQKDKELGSNGGIAWLMLANGEHRLELKKNQKTVLTKKLTVNSKSLVKL